MRRRVVLPTGRFEQFVELQFGGQGSLRQGLLGSDGRDARRSLLAQWRVQQIDALDLPQFVLEPFHGQGRPDRLGLLVQVLQQRHPQQTIEGVLEYLRSFGRREPPVEALILEDHANAPPHGERLAGDIKAEQACAPLGRSEQGREDAEQRGLSAAVGSEQTEDLAPQRELPSRAPTAMER